MHHRTFRHSLTGIAAMLITLTLAVSGSAAIAQGPTYTNAVLAAQHRNTVFSQAEQSFQEQLKVGRERYNQKQVYRAKVIAAMTGELQARQQTVVIHPGSEPDTNTGVPDPRSGLALTVVLLVFGSIGLWYYLKRVKPTLSAPPPQYQEAVGKGVRPLRKRYKVTALKPVTLWANIEVPKLEHSLLGGKVHRTKEEPAWIRLEAGERRDNTSRYARRVVQHENSSN
jgi:hypothetical protein